MRRSAALLLAPVLLSLALVGCGGDGKPKTDAQPANGLPAVSGGYGVKPKITADPKVKPPKTTKSAVLVKGNGPKVAEGDLLVADYLGQIYRSTKVFDNSYDRGQPSAFQIGAGKVIKGWDKTLVGVNVGSRVLMVVPPAEGYGTEGSAQAGIKGTDSLVFVVDVIATYGKQGSAKAPTPVTDLPSGLPKVTGEPTQEPKVTVPKGTKLPTEPAAITLATGSGPKLKPNRLTVLHFVAVNWANQPVASSWDQGAPQAVPLGAKGQPSPFDILQGVPVGSRVLVLLPARAQNGEKAKPNPDETIAAVVDVLGQHGPAKEEVTK